MKIEGWDIIPVCYTSNSKRRGGGGGMLGESYTK
jgi:hypothetical protein